MERIIGLWKGGISYRAIELRVRWTNDCRATRKTGSGRWKVASGCDARQLLRRVMNYSTASSRLLEACWSSATCQLMSASSIRRRLLHRGIGCKVDLYMISIMALHRRLRLQWAHEHRAWEAGWNQLSFQMN
ncbi:transposable element Tcb2 transposase [Trichonephila clavipes]|nr:transposable element Tcb2 transposase [Trichonephila clavipes]